MEQQSTAHSSHLQKHQKTAAPSAAQVVAEGQVVADLLVQLIPHLPGTQAAQHPRPPLPQPSPQGDLVATKSAMLACQTHTTTTTTTTGLVAVLITI